MAKTTHKLSAKDVDKVVRKQLPGWKRSESAGDHPRHSVRQAIKQGPNVSDLRRKFFGGGVADNTAKQKTHARRPSDVQVVHVTPVDGGPSKVAEIRNGRVKIVQG